MTEETIDRRVDWTPRQRPEWLARLNEEADSLDAKSVVPLDENSLLDQARKNTGLSDFGDDGWIDHFRVLLRAIEDEAKLNLFGRMITRSDFVMYLEARLNITECYKRHPEIEDEVITEPVFIIGFGRSGTTILLEVLSQDPQFRVVKRWEASYPCPPPEEATYETDPRIAKAHRRITLFDRITPEWQSMHMFSGDLPVEDSEFTYPAFFGEVFHYAFQIPSFEKYFDSRDMQPTLDWHKRTLKLLQWKYKKPHWLLKWPTALPRIPELMKTYPDAKIIVPHRDPVVSGDSVVNVMGTIFWWRTDEPWGGGVLDQWLLPEQRAKVWDDVIGWMEQGVMPAGSFANVLYHDFLDDPIPTLAKAYSELGLTFTADAAERMRQYLKNKPKDSHGVHSYKALSAAEQAERHVYKRYQAYFNVPNER